MKRETGKWVQKAEPDWEVAHKLASENKPPRAEHRCAFIASKQPGKVPQGRFCKKAASWCPKLMILLTFLISSSDTANGNKGNFLMASF